MNCAPHRPYLSAVADGELDLVPAPTLAHVRSCGACAREIETHGLLTVRLRHAAAPERSRPGSWRRRAAGAAVAVALVAAGVGGLAVWRGQGDQDRVAAVAAAAQRPSELRSRDETAIAIWCELRSGRPMQVVALPSLAATGARADQVAGAEVVTVAYTTDAGSHVTVSWLDAARAPPSVSERTAAGRTVLVVRSLSGTAVVAGDAPVPLLRSIAGDLQGA